MSKDKIILSSIDSSELLESFRAIIREEMAAAGIMKLAEADEQMLSITDACKIFKVTRQTITNWVDCDYLQKHLVGKKPFFKRSELFAAAKRLQRYKKPMFPISK